MSRWEQCGRHPCRCVPWFFKLDSWTDTSTHGRDQSYTSKIARIVLFEEYSVQKSQVICDLPGNLPGYHAIFQTFFLKSRQISAMLRSKLKSEQALSTKEPGNQCFFLRRKQEGLILHVVGITFCLLGRFLLILVMEISSPRASGSKPSCWMQPVVQRMGRSTKDDESSESQRIWIEAADPTLLDWETLGVAAFNEGNSIFKAFSK